jgi:hypothetical protein
MKLERGACVGFIHKDSNTMRGHTDLEVYCGVRIEVSISMNFRELFNKKVCTGLHAKYFCAVCVRLWRCLAISRSLMQGAISNAK